MFNEETRREIRRIEIVTSRLVDEVFGGQYSSLFKGKGVEFAEVRDYLEGDDVRSIDWNLTARFGRPFVKKHEEERELSLVLAVDVSASQTFGSGRHTKAERASELAALLAFSALRNHDKVGLLLFSDRIEKFFPPRSGRQHALRLVREILDPAPRSRGTRLDEALAFLLKVLKRRSLVFLISDFLVPQLQAPLRAPGLGMPGLGTRAGLHGEEQGAQAAVPSAGLGWSSSLERLALRHDVSAFRLVDPREEALPAVGRVCLRDLESGKLRTVDTSAPGFAERLAAATQARREQLRQAFETRGIDFAELSTASSVVEPLVRFFARKGARRRVRGRR